MHFYLIARDDSSVRLSIGTFASWFDAVAYVNAHNPRTWSRSWRVGSA